MLRNKSEFTITALLLVIFAAIAVNAGGPLMMWNAEQRIPYRWSVTTPVKIYTDIGPFEILPANPPAGTVLVTNEKADETVAFAAGQWTDVPSSSFKAEVIGDFASIGLPDVKDAATAALVFGADNGGGIHIVYDADATIMQSFFGAPPTVLGIASPEWADEDTGTITEGWVIINAKQRWFNDNNLQMYAAVFTHEFGHAINLAHSQTNGSIRFYRDATGPANCTLPYAGTPAIAHIETMYPFINQRPGGSGQAQSTVDLSEDKTAISNLYPEADYLSTRGSITGRVLQTNGRDGITGINVIARNLDNPYADAVSAMSGDYVRVEAGNDGTFTLNGLTPGARYALYTDRIVAGGFPTQQPYFVAGPEEFYNGADESGNGLTDDRCAVEPIVAVAGSATEADIILNSVKGAPQFMPLAPGANPNTVSSDGSVVSGGFATSPTTGGVWRWTEEGGYEIIGNTVPTAPFMSRDANAFSAETIGPNGRIASLLHYPGGSWQPVPTPEAIAPAVTMLTCGTESLSFGVAANGSALAGAFNVDANGPATGQTCLFRPFVWTPETGSQALPVPAGIRTSRPNNISGDGSTVMGWYESLGFRMGIKWVNGSMHEFSTPAFTVGEAFNSTPDGSTIIGFNAGPTANFPSKPWRWTQSGGVQLMDKIAPNGIAGATAISDDAQVIAGIGGSTSLDPGDLGGRKLFLWTPELGSVDFVQFLQSQGTFLDGYILSYVPSMSSDGTTLVGSGVAPNVQGGWIVRMSKVNICHAPPGNPGKAHTINVPFRGTMSEHLSHGDTIGVCSDDNGN
jgi:hypothetical protein